MDNKIKKKITNHVKIAFIAGAVLLMVGVSAFAATNSDHSLRHSVVDVVPMSAQGENNTVGMQNDIGIEAAKTKALEQVSGASANNIVKAEKDYDGNRLEYEIEIYYSGYEYEFEIDGATSDIISHDIEKLDNDDKYYYDNHDDEYENNVHKKHHHNGRYDD